MRGENLGRQRTSELLTLLLPSDEEMVWRRLRERLPDLKLLDTSSWAPLSEPPIRMSLEQCGMHVALWDPTVEPDRHVEVVFDSDGSVVGPEGGPVVLWQRGHFRGRVLGAGRFVVSYLSENVAMVEFVRSVWKIVKSATSNKTVAGGRIDGPLVRGAPLRRYWVGPAAAGAFRECSIELADYRMRIVLE